MRVAVVLDQSALCAYGRLDSVAVGELVAVVAEEPDTVVGVPAAVVEAAYWELKEPEQDLIRALLDHPLRPVVVLDLEGRDADRAATLSVEMNTRGAGHVVLAAMRLNAMVATLEPATFTPYVGGTDYVIDVGQ